MTAQLPLFDLPASQEAPGATEPAPAGRSSAPTRTGVLAPRAGPPEDTSAQDRHAAIVAARLAYMATLADDLPDDLRAAGMLRDGIAVFDPGPQDRPGYPSATFMLPAHTLEGNIAAARVALATRAQIRADEAARAARAATKKARRR